MKYLLSVLMVLFSLCMFSQNVSIPDANFKNYLLTNPEVNTNNDSEIQVSEASTFTGSLSFQFWNINDLTGIEAFTNLTFLDCGDNNLTSLDLSQNTALEQLYCYDNNLTSLNLSANTALLALDCRDNQIASLDLSANPLLYYLNCPFNAMSSLNVQNTSMQTLRCYSNSISELDLTTNTELTTLLVYNNDITELDLSNNSSLIIFECQNGSLINLNVANSNNTNVTIFKAVNNPSLECIQVDDEIYSTANWTEIDDTTSFSEDCQSLNVENHSELIFKYYPNPTTNTLHINLLEDIDYEVLSLKGQLLKQGRFLKGNNTLDVSFLPQGMYIIQGETTNGKLISTRFIKK